MGRFGCIEKLEYVVDEEEDGEFDEETEEEKTAFIEALSLVKLPRLSKLKLRGTFTDDGVVFFAQAISEGDLLGLQSLSLRQDTAFTGLRLETLMRGMVESQQGLPLFGDIDLSFTTAGGGVESSRGPFVSPQARCFRIVPLEPGPDSCQEAVAAWPSAPHPDLDSGLCVKRKTAGTILAWQKPNASGGTPKRRASSDLRAASRNCGLVGRSAPPPRDLSWLDCRTDWDGMAAAGPTDFLRTCLLPALVRMGQVRRGGRGGVHRQKNRGADRRKIEIALMGGSCGVGGSSCLWEESRGSPDRRRSHSTAASLNGYWNQAAAAAAGLGLCGKGECRSCCPDARPGGTEMDAADREPDACCLVSERRAQNQHRAPHPHLRDPKS
uniref:Uncharacterized protein n=1 Tax=Chromera velia CCMP2878 TaxID=1169474 RepID=A0A0G4EZK7_9ALVE|eukprot:Cvel_14441.t1-p1 / transcript=Cvel_14441.t1 / gene=Cvel_14441 / organism=Chromera_velia_CCMP2878 / gene_product=hypothetical protein / transcript_product=hypothetical protein / location=Cvel_scaffold1027:54637-58967(+) / protein_length=381 / sequence_SO=supercontig / SO=protein_coding / is_pseudo=false